MEYQILDWDSEFFGVKVARITQPSLTADNLADILSELEAKRVKLVYWASDRECDAGEAKSIRGHLVDTKLTFAADLRGRRYDSPGSADIVEAYAQSMPLADIEDLAIQSGEYSRFAVDPNLSREKFVALYKIWIARSLRKEIASEVLVIREADHVVGMVTLGKKHGRGDIGLMAVDRNFRGRKYGETLVRAAQGWFVKNGCDYGQVVTQSVNTPACNLYKKCGYSVERVEYFYHIWL